MDDIWKSWTEVKRICKDRKVVLFGRSEDWVFKTAPKLSHAREMYIVDSNPAYANSELNGLPVYSPERLLNEEPEDFYIVITAGPYESVSQQLVDMGFSPGEHFCCTPEIRDWGLLQEIRDYNQDIIVSCSDYSERGKKRYSKSGGGIYSCNTRENTFEKLHGGHFRQIVEVDEYLYVVEYVEKKLFVFSKQFKKLHEYPLDQSEAGNEKPNCCGIAFDPSRRQFYVANAGSDVISIFDEAEFKYVDSFRFSNLHEHITPGGHHINDLCITGNSLFVSYFSQSGNYKKGVLDGGVSEFYLDNLGAGAQPLVRGLWSPHSVQFIDGNLCYLDSMRGDFWIGNQKKAGNFPGFTRGLAYDGRFYYVGQSEDMYMSRLFGVSDNIMCNAGVYLFDVKTKVSRFYSFPFIMNVHDLLVLGN